MSPTLGRMTPRQALASAALATLIALAILLEWITLPSHLGAAQSLAVSVSATFRPGKGGHAVVTHASGWQAEVHCGRVSPLCQHLKSQPNQVVKLELVRVGLLDDVWVLSAVVDGQELLQVSEQEWAFGRSKAVHLAIASAFLFAAAMFGGYLYTTTRSSGPDAA